MRLFFLRHGLAEETIQKDDHDRALTFEGVQAMETAAQVMIKLNLDLTHLFTSPRLRAEQTASIAGKALGLTPIVRNELNFGFNLHQLNAILQDMPNTANIMLVGHEPTFSETLNALTGANLAMKKGGLARVDLYTTNPLRGQLIWLIAPKVFSALA